MSTSSPGLCLYQEDYGAKLSPERWRGHESPFTKLHKDFIRHNANVRLIVCCRDKGKIVM